MDCRCSAAISASKIQGCCHPRSSARHQARYSRMGSFFKDFEVVDVNRRACCLPLSTLLFEMASRTFSRLIISAATACILLADVMVRPSIADTRVTRVVALGDSLTAGYGLPNVDAFPSQLELTLRTRGCQVVARCRLRTPVYQGHGCKGPCEVKSIGPREH